MENFQDQKDYISHSEEEGLKRSPVVKFESTEHAVYSRLLEFSRLYQEEFGETLSQDDLERKARMVSNLYIAIYRSPVEAIRAVEEELSKELSP